MEAIETHLCQLDERYVSRGRAAGVHPAGVRCDATRELAPVSSLDQAFRAAPKPRSSIGLEAAYLDGRQRGERSIQPSNRSPAGNARIGQVSVARAATRAASKPRSA